MRRRLETGTGTRLGPRRRTWIGLAAALLVAAPAAAEGFLDVYGGAAFTRDDDVDVSGAGFGSTGVELEESAVVGGRLGLWLEAIPVLGGAVDVSAYNADGKDAFDPADIDIVPLSALVLLRLPLFEGSDFPAGRLQPYAGVGPSLVISTFDLAPVFDDETEIDLGVDARLGVAGLVSPRFGLFFEWRYLHFEPRYDGGAARLATEISTHVLQGGLRLQF